MPRAWDFLGSNDSVNWNLIDTRSEESAWTANSRRMYPVTSPNMYRYYRIKFRSVNGSNFLRIYGIILSEDQNCKQTIP